MQVKHRSLRRAFCLLLSAAMLAGLLSALGSAALAKDSKTLAAEAPAPVGAEAQGADINIAEEALDGDIAEASEAEELAPENAAFSFRDVEEGSDLALALETLCPAGIMEGSAADTFDPNGALSRAMVAAVLWRMEGAPQVYGNGSYSDVPFGEWYTTAVAWATLRGYLTGFEDNTFRPDEPMTLEQMLTVFWRYAGSPAAPSCLPALNASDWARDAVCWANAEGLVMAIELLYPQNNATRKQVALIAAGLLNGLFAD